MLNVVLLEPEIPTNTGTIGRSCVLTGSALHLIEPLGFSLDDAHVRRSGMGYWHDIDLHVYGSFEQFEQQALEGGNAHMWMFTKTATACYHEVSYADGDFLVFGRESRGIDSKLLVAHPGSCLRIPMMERRGMSPATTRHGPSSDPADPDAVSLNLSNAANIVLFEALRQLGFPGMVHDGHPRRDR